MEVFRLLALPRDQTHVFSTYVEVFLDFELAAKRGVGFLHVCGGVSARGGTRYTEILFSPRMWRCFYLTLLKLGRYLVFSTYVEVFLRQFIIGNILLCFLHVCGGVSNLLDQLSVFQRFSPRMWRCFCFPFYRYC